MIAEYVAAVQPRVWREMCRRWPRLTRLVIDEVLARLMKEKPRRIA